MSEGASGKSQRADDEVDPNLGPCYLCFEPSVTEVIVVPGRQKRKTAPVCNLHATSFEERGILTVRMETSRMLEVNRPQKEW